jgi:hypothetical protein
MSLKPFRLIGTLFAAVALAACGGGSDAPPAAPSAALDKYVGTWGGCVITAADQGTLHTIIITKTSATTGVLSIDRTPHAVPDCSGPVSGTAFKATSTFVVDEEQTIVEQGISVDVALVSLGTPYTYTSSGLTLPTTSKQSFALARGQFFLGLEAGTFVEGYPTGLWIPPFSRK